MLGWTFGVARRHSDFLCQINEKAVDGFGLSLSFTVGFIPKTAADFFKVRRRFWRLVKEQCPPIIRRHWLVEFQSRRAPHMHSAVYFSAPVSSVLLKRLWMRAARDYRPALISQDIKPLRKIAALMRYFDRHAGRAAWHKQRSPESIPPGWEYKTGRMWGRSGAWPLQEILVYRMALPAFHCARRLLRSWAVADSRSRLADSPPDIVDDGWDEHRAARFRKRRQGDFRFFRSSKNMLSRHDARGAGLAATISRLAGLNLWVNSSFARPALESLRGVCLVADDEAAIANS